jgi:RNA polymerase sigma factor (sigma-70 family)
VKFADSDILKAINQKDEKNQKVLEFLYHEVLPKVQNYVLNNSGNADDAFDVFQDAMVAFCKYVKMNKFNEKYSVSGFIYSVSKNLWINKARKQKKVVLTEETEVYEKEVDTQNALNFLISNEREEEVRQLFNKLGERCRQLLQMSIYQELSGKEICEKMGFASENGVKTQKYKCKQKLLQIIKEQKSTLLER